jgi:hypothetical protein
MSFKEEKSQQQQQMTMMMQFGMTTMMAYFGFKPPKPEDDLFVHLHSTVFYFVYICVNPCNGQKNRKLQFSSIPKWAINIE